MKFEEMKQMLPAMQRERNKEIRNAIDSVAQTPKYPIFIGIDLAKEGGDRTIFFGEARQIDEYSDMTPEQIAIVKAFEAQKAKLIKNLIGGTWAIILLILLIQAGTIN